MTLFLELVGFIFYLDFIFVAIARCCVFSCSFFYLVDSKRPVGLCIDQSNCAAISCFLYAFICCMCCSFPKCHNCFSSPVCVFQSQSIDLIGKRVREVLYMYVYMHTHTSTFTSRIYCFDILSMLIEFFSLKVKVNFSFEFSTFKVEVNYYFFPFPP